MDSCLTEAELRHYLADSLSDRSREQTAEHLQECPACAQRLERLREEWNPSSDQPHQWPTAVDWSDGGDEQSDGQLGSHSSDLSEPDMQPVPLPPVSLSISELLEHLSQSGLLAPAEIDIVRGQPVADPQQGGAVVDLVNWLIQQEKLTPYQANRLCRGQASSLVLGNYIILDKVGQGGMGAVFKARHRRMNRLVALKVLPGSLSSIPEAIARFQREVEAAARLHHAHIAAAYDADEAERVHFLVMEFVDGPNLATYVREKGPLPVAAAVRLIGQAAEGLSAAHAQGIVHRDIKPSNLMVNRQGALKVLDLGLAQVRDSSMPIDLTTDVTQTGRTMGTVDYMAPEQARDAKAVDARADIYSLGCTLYYLLVGRTPAPPGSAAEKLLWHQTQHAEPLIDVCPGCTARLESLVKRMMAKEPDERPTSMIDVAIELENCLHEMPAGTGELSLDGIEILPGDPSSTVHGNKAARGTIFQHGDTLVSGLRLPGMIEPAPTRAQSRGRLIALAAGIVSLAAIAAVAFLPRLLGPSRTASEQGTLIVAASEAPAEVYLDGAWIGRVETTDRPLQLALSPGERLIEVRRPGYRAYEKRIQTQAGELTSVVAALQPAEKLPAPAITRPGTSPHAAYEKLLAWVWEQEGTVEVKTSDGHTRNVTALDQLPSEPVEIVTIGLDGSGVKDQNLAELKATPRLVELSLADTKITDEGLKWLIKLTHLTRLDLSKTSVKSGVAQLANLSRLTDLNLADTQVTDQAIIRLANLPKLRWLHLTNTPISDAGIKELKSITTLEALNVKGTSLTQETYDDLTRANNGLKINWDGADRQRAVAARLLDKGATLAVAGPDSDAPLLTGLKTQNALPMGRVVVKQIDLSTGANFGDEDLKSLVVLGEIELLNLVNANVTPAGLVHLQGLATLKTLHLPAHRLSDAALEAIARALPQCQVILKEPLDAEVAQEVVRKGGRVSVVTNSGADASEISRLEDLPGEMYWLRAIDLKGAKEIDTTCLLKLHELSALESLNLSETDVADACLAQLAGCKSLRSLTLSDTRITSDGVAALARLPALRQLYLARTKVGGEGVRRAASLAGLTHLSLQGVEVADANVALLKRLEHLQWLDLSSTSITDAALPHLNQLARLESLIVKGTKLSDDAIEQLAESHGANRVVGNPPDPQRQAAKWIIDNRGTVVLATGPITKKRGLPAGPCQIVSISLASLESLHPDDIVKHLAACTALKELDLRGVRLGDEDLAVLSQLTELVTLNLAEMSIADAALAHLAPLHQLESLDLSRTHVTGSGLAYLSGATGLKHLHLSYAPIQAGHLKSLAVFGNLQTLDLSANSSAESLTDDGLIALEDLPTLRVLGLRTAKITDASLDRVAKLNELEGLDLEGTPVSDAGVEKLAGLSRLSRLSLTRTGVTDGVTETLAKMKSLRSLALRQTRISPESIRALQAALSQCTISAPTPRDPNRFDGQSGSREATLPVLSGLPQ
jgi:serine/threonine protein kinase/Leucine-rich repeat (LRR) protein